MCGAQPRLKVEKVSVGAVHPRDFVGPAGQASTVEWNLCHLTPIMVAPAKMFQNKISLIE
jgi:hypothetical protein